MTLYTLANRDYYKMDSRCRNLCQLMSPVGRRDASGRSANIYSSYCIRGFIAGNLIKFAFVIVRREQLK